MKQNEPKKRNYVKRKRSLSESTKIILSTLQLINSNSPNPVDNNELTNIAINHAKAIEATCWSRRAKFSDEIFQTIIRTKTTELCQTLLSSSFSGLVILSKNGDPSFTSSSHSSTNQNGNGFISMNQQKVNNLAQQQYIMSSSNDSPSTSPNTSSFDCVTSINEVNNNTYNGICQIPVMQNYALPSSDIQVSQPSISLNPMIQPNSNISSQYQQPQFKQLYCPLNLNQTTKDYNLRNPIPLNSSCNTQENSQKNRPFSDLFFNGLNSSNFMKHPVEDEGNENNVNQWSKNTHKVKFPSISSLLS